MVACILESEPQYYSNQPSAASDYFANYTGKQLHIYVIILFKYDPFNISITLVGCALHLFCQDNDTWVNGLVEEILGLLLNKKTIVNAVFTTDIVRRCAQRNL